MWPISDHQRLPHRAFSPGSSRSLANAPTTGESARSPFGMRIRAPQSRKTVEKVDSSCCSADGFSSSGITPSATNTYPWGWLSISCLQGTSAHTGVRWSPLFFFTSPESPIQRDWTRVGKSSPRALIIFSIQSNCSSRLALPFHHFLAGRLFLPPGSNT